MKARSFSHTGITVSDFNRAVRFWWDVFGCPLVGVSDAPPDRVRGFFGVDGRAHLQDRLDPNPRRRGHRDLPLRAGAAAAPVAWSRIGLTHICLNVRGIRHWHDYLVSKGLEIVSPPEQSPRGHWLFFVKDFDGNLIEITDLGYMYHVLNWLGPLGGWVFRRGMYKKYYE